VAATTSTSYPPGARWSSRTFPVSSTDDSCPAFSSASQASGGTAFFDTTACANPDPSRTIRNWSFPLERLL
jgi:hypothetical protein